MTIWAAAPRLDRLGLCCVYLAGTYSSDMCLVRNHWTLHILCNSFSLLDCHRRCHCQRKANCYRHHDYHAHSPPRDYNSVAVHQIRGQFLREHIQQNGCCGERELLKLWAYTLTQYHRVFKTESRTPDVRAWPRASTYRLGSLSATNIF